MGPNRTFTGLVALSLLTMMVSGCLEGADSDALKKNLGGKGAASAPKPPAAISKVTAVTEQVLVSPAGHRIAEYMVARNPLDPDHLLLAAHDYDSGTGTLACVIYMSRDGGSSWVQAKKVPGLDRPHLQFDGWISFDMSGTAHYVCLDSAGPNLQTWPYYSHSTDGGMTWSQAVLIPRTGDSTDKSALHAATDGRVYVAFGGQVARTDDNGKTWMNGKTTGSGSGPNGFAEDKDGNVYLWVRGGGGGRVTRTSDRGETWNHTLVGPFSSPPGYNDQNRWVDQRPWITLPSIAVDPMTDHLFVVQQSWDTASNFYKITLYRSIDRGVSFQNVTVPDFKSSTCTPCSITHPSIAFDDAGRLGLLVQLTNDGGHIKEVMFSASADGGATWVPAMVLSKTAPPNEWMNPRAFTPNPQGFAGWAQGFAADPTQPVPKVYGLAATTLVQELQMRWNGEYWGIAASSKGFVVPWIDHSANGAPQLFSRLLKAE